MLAFDYESSEAHVRALTTILFLGPHYSPKSLVNSAIPSSRQSRIPRSLTDITAQVQHLQPEPERRMRTFPSEIYERVIYFCVDLDSEAAQYPGVPRDTLCNLTLTSRAWKSRAQIHLYSRVYLESEHQLRKFSSTVQSHPALALHVRELELSGRYAHTERKDGSEDYWMYYAAVHLPLLPSLRKITLRYLPVAGARSFMVFAQFRKFNTVEDLWLASPRTLHSGDLGRILSSFPQLKQLSITQSKLTCINTHSIPSPHPHACSQLSSLCLDMPLQASSGPMSEILKWFSECSDINFTNLSCTQFRVGQHHNALWKLFQKCGRHLKQLNLEWPPCHDDTEPDRVDLGALSELEQLSLSHVNVRDIARIVSIIETFNSPRDKQLTVKLTFSQDAWPLKDEDWDLLNEGLLRPKGIGKLVLTYYVPVEHKAVHNRTHMEEMERGIRRNMPRLAVAFRKNLVIRLHLRPVETRA